ncbi:MATE family efflux transporter [Salinispora arenicola]|uniref:MATE family efflux transporter n=1 Tax=Salinispora arenicola TaxID=168697 RepID=UPI00036C6D05|nr:MATE family efflux transporter [Salinispora arenicola]
MTQQTWDVPGANGASVRRAIVRLAVPMALAEVAGLVVLVGVMALMGRMGEETLYVRALYLPIGHLFIAVYVAFGFSNQVAAAISRGRGRPEDVAPMAMSFVRMWAVASVVLVAATLLAAPLLAAAFDVPDASRSEFMAFLRWMAAAELLQVVAILCASGLRGYGHGGAGAAVVVVSAAVQFAGVALLGLAAGMGAMSVPLSIAVGSVVGALLGVWLMRRHGLIRFGAELTRWHPESARHIRSVGLPVATTQLILFGANFGLLWVLGDFGPRVIAGFSSAVTLQFLVLMPAIVLGSATAIVLNQQRGAGRADWLPGTMHNGLAITVGAYLLLSVVMWAGSDLFGRLMTDSPSIADQTALYLSTVGLTYVLMGPVLTSLTVMEQIGSGLLAVVLNLVYFAAIVVIGALVVAAVPEPVALYRTIAWCNLAGVIVVLAGLHAVRRASRLPAPTGAAPVPVGGGPA